MGWFNVLMTDFIVACVAGYYFSPIHIISPFCLLPYPLPLSTPATQAKFMVVSGHKDGVDLVLIYCYVAISSHDLDKKKKLFCIKQSLTV